MSIILVPFFTFVSCNGDFLYTPRHPFIVLKTGKSKQTVSQSMVSNKRNGTIHGYTEENNNNNNNISGYLFIQLMNMGSLSDIIWLINC